jgi:hypothetical protein
MFAELDAINKSIGAHKYNIGCTGRIDNLVGRNRTYLDGPVSSKGEAYVLSDDRRKSKPAQLLGRITVVNASAASAAS